jgi:hypothetical protein
MQHFVVRVELARTGSLLSTGRTLDAGFFLQTIHILLFGIGIICRARDNEWRVHHVPHSLLPCMLRCCSPV